MANVASAIQYMNVHILCTLQTLLLTPYKRASEKASYIWLFGLKQIQSTLKASSFRTQFHTFSWCLHSINLQYLNQIFCNTLLDLLCKNQEFVKNDHFIELRRVICRTSNRISTTSSLLQILAMIETKIPYCLQISCFVWRKMKNVNVSRIKCIIAEMGWFEAENNGDNYYR